MGSSRYPVETSDQSSFLLQAQASKAKVVALAGSGTVFVNAVKAAQEFGIQKGGQTLAGLLVWITDIKSLGLEAAQGLVLTNAFYWDRDDETRAWSKRFFERMKRPPHMGDAGDYSSTMHYLKAIEAAGTDDAKAVMAKMREMPINDFFAKNGRIREDGRMVHDMYVYEVKKPSESKGEWDYYKLRAVIPGDEAFRSAEGQRVPAGQEGLTAYSVQPQRRHRGAGGHGIGVRSQQGRTHPWFARSNLPVLVEPVPKFSRAGLRTR